MPTRVRSQAKWLDYTQPISYWSQYLCCFSACMRHKRRPTVCLWQQADNVAYCQRMSTDEIPCWAPGASLHKRRFNHMALQAQHTLEEEAELFIWTMRRSLLPVCWIDPPAASASTCHVPVCHTSLTNDHSLDVVLDTCPPAPHATMYNKKHIREFLELQFKQAVPLHHNLKAQTHKSLSSKIRFITYVQPWASSRETTVQIKVGKLAIALLTLGLERYQERHPILNTQ